MEEIKVSIFRRSGQQVWQMQYRIPGSTRKGRRTTGKRKKADAQRIAAQWERELMEGHNPRRGRIKWADFRRRYEAEVLPGLAKETAAKVSGVFNSLESIAAPDKLSDLTADSISRYAARLRKNGLSETTIRSHLSHIKSVLNWAAKQSLLAAVPKFTMPKRASKGKMMKGRPITTEEFERMLEKIGEVLYAPAARKPRTSKASAAEAAPIESPSPVAKRLKEATIGRWRHLLKGLWTSGLRLAESLQLHWTDESRLHIVGLDSKAPMLRIRAEDDKGNQERLMPLAPEFAEFLRQTPPEDREGFVFNPCARRQREGDRMTKHQVSRIIGAIGKAAGVKVDEKAKPDAAAKVKYASAHDLRRAFGERWSKRVMPAVLQQLMRHESIQTTLLYYVGRNAEATSAVLWEAYRASAEASPAEGQADRASCSRIS